ncbi:MAG: hypothetical protein K2Q34_00430 [Alphaproteobacteria bacterium]|nr:hypothetical protein [Alphaproteobacteria bacterium]
MKHVEICWEPTGYLVEVNSAIGEHLFAYGNGKKTIPDSWMLDGINYEFRLYEDQERTKPIAKLLFIKHGNVIKQETIDLKSSSNASSTSSAPVLSATPSPSLTPSAALSPDQGSPLSNHNHKKAKQK